MRLSEKLEIEILCEPFQHRTLCTGTREWKIVKTKGYPVKGGYGHSSAWDPLTQRIYVYGGFSSNNMISAHISDRLYSYEPSTRLW